MKFRRYASWMRRLNFDMDPFVSDEVHRLISANLSNETLCPRLQELTWAARSYPFEHRFLSPRLFSFTWFYMGPPPDGVVPNLTSATTSFLSSIFTDRHLDSTDSKGFGVHHFLRYPSMQALSHHTIRINALVAHGNPTHHAAPQLYRMGREERAA